MSLFTTVGLGQSLPQFQPCALHAGDHVLTRVAILNKVVLLLLLLNYSANCTWWQRSLTLKMPDNAAKSHQETLGLPSGTQENEDNPQQPSQRPLPGTFDGANGPKQAEC